MQADAVTRDTGMTPSHSPKSKRTHDDRKTKRVLELDLLKTVAVISMVLVHTLEVPKGLEVQTSNPLNWCVASVIEFFGCVPSAGVFMFAMGWGAASSARATVRTHLDRFLQLTILGLVVNFFQQLVPMLLDPDHFGAAVDHLYTIIAVDIYQFCSLVMFYFMAMQVLGRSTRAAKAFSVTLACVCMLVNALVGVGTLATGNMWVDSDIGFMIRQNEYSYFPFVSWIVFPVAGYLTSFLYGKVRDRRNLPTLLIVAGMSVITLSEVLMELFGVSDVIIRNVLLNEWEYYAMHPACALGAFGIIAVEFALASWYLRWRDGRLPAFATFVSRNIMRIYVAQWVVIGLLSPILFHVTNVELNALIGTGILAFCCFGTWLYTAHVKRSSEKERKA